jgi:phosphoglucomutase
VGKTLISSQMIDRVTECLGLTLYEVPVGFKWFVRGLLEMKLGFAGEESAGATFLRKNGIVWTTDKDGIAAALLSAEMTAKLGRDPAQIYAELTTRLGHPLYRRMEAPANASQRRKLSTLAAKDIQRGKVGTETVLTKAPGNHAPIGGIKVETKEGWFAVRPSGTEDIYKIYAESFLSHRHLDTLLQKAQSVVKQVLKSKDKIKPKMPGVSSKNRVKRVDGKVHIDRPRDQAMHEWGTKT